MASWVQRVHGLDLDPYRPVLALLAVVLHVPVIAGMMGALVVLDDLDDGVLQVIRVSPLGVRRYLAYRLGAVTGFAALGLAVAAPLSGVVPLEAAGAVVLAVPVAPLFTLAVLAVARNRVQGLTVTKVIGLPVYAPITAWWLTGAAAWAFAVLPPFWVVRSWTGPDPALLAAGTLCTALWLVALTRHVLRRL
jgi:fluoroquinolone transport system permease protein